MRRVTTSSQHKRSLSSSAATASSRAKRSKHSQGSKGITNAKTEPDDLNDQKPKVVIDHLGFAHIIDVILDYGGPAVWHSFRATCKRYYERIPGPVNRIVLSRKRSDLYAAVGHPGDCPVGIDDYIDGSAAASRLGDLPLTLTRTLDIRNGVSRSGQLPWADEFAPLRVVRATTEGLPAIPAPVYVIICDMHPIPYFSGHVQPSTIKVTSAQRKLVVAIHFHRLSSTTKQLGFYFPEVPRRLVLHFVLDAKPSKAFDPFEAAQLPTANLKRHNWSAVKLIMASVVQQVCWTATSRGKELDLSRIPVIELVDVHRLVTIWVHGGASLADSEKLIRAACNDAIDEWGSGRPELVPELKAALNRKMQISTAERYAVRERIEESNLWLERGLHFGRQREL